MRLTGLSYKTTNWELNEIEFEDVSLIVGKNATGKTRTLAVLHLLYEIITQKREIFEPGEWEISFANGEDNYIYKFQTAFNNAGYVVNEEMTINGVSYIIRNGGESYFRIKNLITKKLATGTPPLNKLVIHVARDVKKYPFIEDIIRWAEQCFGFRFGNIYPKFQIDTNDYSFLSTTDDVLSLFYQISEDGKNKIKEELRKIGFPMINIEVLPFADKFFINIWEQEVYEKIPHTVLSQGMFRSLAVLIFMEHLISDKDASSIQNSSPCIIIDDLCEGLDYERATKLGRLLFDKCLANNIQLIATSNDMFLMDVVDLKYWNVLQRNGQVVTAINAKNHPALFDDFKFTGLSNFDFFASDYIAKNL